MKCVVKSLPSEYNTFATVIVQRERQRALCEAMRTSWPQNKNSMEIILNADERDIKARSVGRSRKNGVTTVRIKATRRELPEEERCGEDSSWEDNAT